MKNVLFGKAKKFLVWLKGQPLVLKLQQRHPQIFRFTVDRFDPKVFIGLPLTLMVIAFMVNVALLSELAESVVESESIVVIDQKFTTLLFEMRSESLSKSFFVITQLAGRGAVFVVGGIASIIFLSRRRFVALIAFWLTMAGVGLSTRYGKIFFSRLRPEDVAYYTVEHFSFPSGHATTAITLYGLLAYFLYRHYQRREQRKLLLWISIILILLIGSSRIYLGVHYLSDVLAGFLLGALWLLVGISWMEVLTYQKKKKVAKPL